jgi:hypothetical protein
MADLPVLLWIIVASRQPFFVVASRHAVQGPLIARLT